MGLFGSIGGLVGLGDLGKTIDGITGDFGIKDVAAPIAGYFGTQSTNSAAQANSQANNQFNADQQRLQNEWQSAQNQQAQNASADQAKRQMDFQQSSLNQQQAFAAQQSSTQYQRAVADMKAAGINPMLAALNGGNSAASMSNASGASGQSFAGSSHGASSAGLPQVQNKMQGALNAMSSAADVDYKKALADKTEAETKNVNKDTDLKSSQILINANIPDKLAAEIIKLRTENDVAKGLITLNKAYEKHQITAAQLDQARIYLTNNESSTETAKQNLLYDQTIGQQQENKLREPFSNNPNATAAGQTLAKGVSTAASAFGAIKGTSSLPFNSINYNPRR
jgi:hypothetical protein